METGKSLKALPCYAVLLIITLAAGLVLGGTYMLTKDAISERQRLEVEQTRAKVLKDAVSFEEVALDDNAPLDWLYAGKDADGNTIGYVGQVTVNGYKAEIEVISGVTLDGKLTGISVGGSNFSETVGLGAKTKDEDFTDRFTGKCTPVTILKTGDAADPNGVDAVTGATISSRAVADAVNSFGAYVSQTFLANEAPADNEGGEGV